MGSNVHQNKVRYSHYIVSPCEDMQFVLRSALSKADTLLDRSRRKLRISVAIPMMSLPESILIESRNDNRLLRCLSSF